MEYGICSLKDMLDAGRVYNEPEISLFLETMISSLNNLRIKLGLAHRDIKPANIILNSKGNGFKWADFGESVFGIDN